MGSAVLGREAGVRDVCSIPCNTASLRPHTLLIQNWDSNLVFSLNLTFIIPMFAVDRGVGCSDRTTEGALSTVYLGTTRDTIFIVPIPYPSTELQRCLMDSYTYPRLGTATHGSSAHSLPPACSWLSGFWLRCSPLSYPWLHPVSQDLSYQYHGAQGASEMMSLGSMCGEGGHLSSLNTMSSQHLTQRLVQGRRWENVRSWMS